MAVVIARQVVTHGAKTFRVGESFDVSDFEARELVRVGLAEPGAGTPSKKTEPAVTIGKVRPSFVLPPGQVSPAPTLNASGNGGNAEPEPAKRKRGRPRKNAA